MNPPATAAAAALHRLRPRPEERDLATNILALLALPLLVFLCISFLKARVYHLEFPVLTHSAVTFTLDVDRGPGWETQAQPVVRLEPSSELQTVRYELPLCTVNQLILYISAPASLQIGTGEFRSVLNVFLNRTMSYASLPPAGFEPGEGTANLLPGPGGSGRIITAPGAPEAAFLLPINAPLVLKFNATGFALAAVIGLAEYLLGALGALLAWRRLRSWAPARRRLEAVAATGSRLASGCVAWVRAHPCAAIWVVAATGVVLSCYPVIFFGKSFVSPNVGATLLYDRFPTLPGYTDGTTSEPQGSDVLATTSAFVPYAMVQRRALVEDHEFPLMDRYNQCGLPLLAQGQTMIGDPLHVLMLLLGANAWAWDLRFLWSRLLFAAAVGLIVRLTTRQTAAALLLTFGCCFLGFFQYRLNHPTYFCLCYAPWILYAWLRLPSAGGWREAAPSVGLLLLANWFEMNAGPVKDAYLLTICLNLTGVLILLIGNEQPWSRRWRVLGLALWCQGLLILASNPFWVTSLDMVVHSWNIYLTPRLWQLQPNLLIGFFDDIFARQFENRERIFAPATNFVVFLGFAFALSYGKRLVRQRTFVAIGVSGLLTAAVTFGVVSPEFIKPIPFLGNVMHLDDIFANILIVYVVVLAGYGLAEGRKRILAANWTIDYLAAVGWLVFLGAVFLGSTQAAQRSAVHALRVNEEVAKSFFFWCDATGICAAFVALPLLLRKLLRDRGRTALGLTPWIVLCVAAMVWRQGQHLRYTPALDRYLSRPQARVDFYARSTAVDFIHQQGEDPGRVVGLHNNLFPGTSGMFGFEGITGSDALLIPAYHYLLAAQLPIVWDWRPAIDKDTIESFKATFDMLNVRYYLGAPHGRDIAVAGVDRVAKLDLDVFESRDVWPRAFFTSTLSTSGSPTDFVAEVAKNVHPFATRRQDWPETALPPGVTALPANQAQRVVVPATHYRLTNNNTSFEVHAPSAGVIALMEVFNGENKKVLVNGQATPHFPVNMAFEGIYVDHAGNYTVSVQSWPRYLTAGLYVSAVGVVLLLATGAAVYWPARRRQAQPYRLREPELASDAVLG